MSAKPPLSAGKALWTRARIPSHVMPWQLAAEIVIRDTDTSIYPTGRRVTEVIGRAETVAAADRHRKDEYDQLIWDMERDAADACVALTDLLILEPRA